MTYYFVSGNVVNVEPSDSLDVLDHLPPRTYFIKENPMTKKLYLQTTADFVLPSKIYGNSSERCNRIVNTFMQRKKSTGVLFSGDKGSGKSLLTKMVAIELQKKNIPVIIITEARCGEEFNNFIAAIAQDAVIIFDEFDKTYKKEDQESLLTLLDGAIETKKLFMFTVNSGHVDQHMMNRPGRIYYKYNYRGLDENFIEEYSRDNLNPEYISYLSDIKRVTSTFSMFTFDMLQAMLEEINRYGETPYQVMEHLNVDFTSESIDYEINLMYDGEIVTNSIYPSTINTSPLFEKKYITIYTGKGKTFTDEFDDELDIKIGPDNVYKVSKGGAISYKFDVRGKDLIVHVERKAPRYFDWKIV